MRLKRTLFISACVALVLIAITTAATALTITSMTPSTVPAAGGTYTAHVYGTGFVSGAQVVLTGGGTTISPTNEAFISSTHIQFTLTVPAMAASGSYSLRVTNPGGINATKSGALTKTPSVMTVSSVSPAYGNQGRTFTIYVSGTGFTTDSQVKLTYGSYTIQATGETTETPGRIRCTVTVPSPQPLGAYTVSVQGRGSPTWYSKASAFTVMGPLSVSSISPTSAMRDQKITATVYGANFAPGAQVRLTGGGTTIDATSETRLSSTQISCTLTIPAGAYLGLYTVSVQNPGMTTWAAKSLAFTVKPVANPTVTGCSPISARTGQTITFYVNGNGFTQRTQVWIAGGSPYTTISGLSEYTVSPTQVRCSLTIPATAGPGTYSIYAQNPPLTTYGSKAGGFTVIKPHQANLGWFYPSYCVRGSGQYVDVYGQYFQPGVQVELRSPDGTMTVQATSETITQDQNEDEVDMAEDIIRCYISIPSTYPTGVYSAVVLNPGASPSNRRGVYTVYANSGQPPTVTGIYPPNDLSYPPTDSYTIYGTNFLPGATVTFIREDGGQVIAAYKYYYDGIDRLRTYIDHDALRGIREGSTRYTVRVTNPNGYYGQLVNGYYHWEVW